MWEGTGTGGDGGDTGTWGYGGDVRGTGDMGTGRTWGDIRGWGTVAGDSGDMRRGWSVGTRSGEGTRGDMRQGGTVGTGGQGDTGTGWHWRQG